MSGILALYMKTFCIGDIHGAYKALMQCLERSGFSYSHDRLIVLGDVCDGYAQVNLCIDELLKIKHCYYIVGNHDLWAVDWALNHQKPSVWLEQGGVGTIASYGEGPMPAAHVDFLRQGRFWLEMDNKLFVHGGFNPQLPIHEQDKEKFVWDRELIVSAYRKSTVDADYKFSTYEDIFLGHTPTRNFHSSLPQHFCNVWALDTGCGWGGALTIMDIHSKHFWQSDVTAKLYEGIRGR